MPKCEEDGRRTRDPDRLWFVRYPPLAQAHEFGSLRGATASLMLTLAFVTGSPVSVTQDSALLPQAGSSTLVGAEPTAGGAPKCLAIMKGVSDEWCKKNCWGLVRFCPESQCDCAEAPPETTGNETDATDALVPAEQPDHPLLPSPSPEPPAHLSKATKATAKTTRGHHGAEKAEAEPEETGSRHSGRAKHHKKVAHHTKQLHAISAMHKSRAARSQAKDKLLCASSPCLSFCPLNPECDGKSAVTPVSANQTDASEEAEFEADEEAGPVSRKGHAHFTASRRSQHRRGKATDAQARLTESSQLREDRERKKLHDVTDTLAERTEERRASKEIEERKKLTDLTEELCAEDPCQVGCPPNAACALVVNSGIDGEVQFEAEEDAAAADAASSALTAATAEEAATVQV